MPVVDYFVELEHYTTQRVADNETKLAGLNNDIQNNLQDISNLQDGVDIHEQRIVNLTTEVEHIEEDLTGQIESIVLEAEGLPRNLTVTSGSEFSAIVCTGTTPVVSTSTDITNAPKGSILVKSDNGWCVLNTAPADGMCLTSNSLSPLGVSWFAI